MKNVLEFRRPDSYSDLELNQELERLEMRMIPIREFTRMSRSQQERLLRSRSYTVREAFGMMLEEAYFAYKRVSHEWSAVD